MLNLIIWNKTVFILNTVYCSVGCGCRIHRLYLCRGVRLPNKFPRYDTKQSDDEIPVMLEFGGIRINRSLPAFPYPPYPRVVAPDGVLSVGQIELNCVLNWITWNKTVLIFRLCTYAKLNCLK